MTLAPEAHHLDVVNLGVVGTRVLVAVQTFDIVRLTTHAVPIVPGTFIAVTGSGPDGDSNGSGKSSFLGAVSLLLGEPQWRLTSDGRLARALLFKPESAGLSAEQGYHAAEYGYVAGVFAPDPLNPAADAITVWVRIAASAPYVRARWAAGVLVADGDTDQERYQQADELWNALRANEAGARSFASALYGDAPRCLAYLDPTIRKSAPSLLSQQLAHMTPERIAESLIGLTGREHLLDTEAEQRRRLAEQKLDLDDKIDADKAARVNEAADLEGVHWRDRARERLARGDALWELHFARGLLEKLSEEADASERVEDAREKRDEALSLQRARKEEWEALRNRTDLATAAEAAEKRRDELQEQDKGLVSRRAVLRERGDQLANRHADLMAVRDGWDGSSVDQAAGRVEEAAARLSDAALQRRTAEQDERSADEALQLTRSGLGGPAGAAVSALLDEGIPAVAVLDVIRLDQDARAAWEPRLWPHRGAVAVAPEDEDIALVVLADMPGAALVVADDRIDAPVTGQMPPGVYSSQPLSAFLAGLAATLAYRDDPDRVTDQRLRESTLGGFAAEIAGRHAQIAAAETALNTARARLAAARKRESARNTDLNEAQAQLRAAQAVRELGEIEGAQRILDEQVAAVDTAAATLAPQLRNAQDALVQALAAKDNHDQQVNHARERLTFAGQAAALRQRDHEDAVRRKDALNLPYWQQGWARPAESAQQLLDSQPIDSQRLTARSLRTYAAEALNEALLAYEHAAGGVLPPELTEVMQRRRQLADGFGGVAGDSVDFATVARPLRDLLDARRDADQVLQERIIRAQAERTIAIGTAQREASTLETDLRNTQEAIAGRIDSALRSIGDAFNELDLRRPGGYGAGLRIEQLPPSGATDPWRWKVTPVWRRSPSGGMVSYQQSANTAQVKVAAIQLVLAALLAVEGGAGRILILDELGDSLGDVNRKQVLAAVSEVARRQEVTIMGTCQDSVIDDAAGVCGEIMWFSHASRAEPYNHPTRAWGFDAEHERVALIADWLRAGRAYA